MKISAEIIAVDSETNRAAVRLPDGRTARVLSGCRYIDIITEPDRKHRLRKKIFSLLGFLWDNGIYEIFGAMKDALKEAVGKIEYYKGREYARTMYRYNICLQCGFTHMTIGLFPGTDGGFVRMFGETARSLSDESGITYGDLIDFYNELEYLVVYYCGAGVFDAWQSRYKDESTGGDNG